MFPTKQMYSMFIIVYDSSSSLDTYLANLTFYVEWTTMWIKSSAYKFIIWILMEFSICHILFLYVSNVISLLLPSCFLGSDLWTCTSGHDSRWVDTIGSGALVLSLSPFPTSAQVIASLCPQLFMCKKKSLE